MKELARKQFDILRLLAEEKSEFFQWQIEEKLVVRLAR